MAKEHEANRKAWSEAAKAYQKDLEESIQFLKNGGKNFCPPELEILKPLAGISKTCIHLQCADGTDTLSFINLGIQEVVGVDISDAMIEIARKKSEILKMNARWYVSDILNTPSELNNSADLVYTGSGSINWIMDIVSWGKVVFRLLKPGGYFYIFEGHPITYLFKMESTKLEIDPDFQGYFSNKIYQSEKWPDTYIGNKTKENEHLPKHERAWPVSAVISSLLDSGLALRAFQEHPDTYWNEFPNLPEIERTKFPNTFSILMQKPL